MLNYPAKVLLANDDRAVRFLDASICNIWAAAVDEWRCQKLAGNAFQKQSLNPSRSDTVSSVKVKLLTDDEFFSLTQQLEDINAVIAASSPAQCRCSNFGDTSSFPNETQDLFAIDPAMYSAPLDDARRRKCQVATEAYQKGNFNVAAEAFTEVINSCLPNMLSAALIGNRAACYLRIENFKLSLRDAMRCCELDNQYILGVRRAVRSYICTGRCSEAREIIDKYRKTSKYTFEEELNQVSLYELYISFFDRNEHAEALKYLNDLLMRVPCATLQSLKVQLLAIEEGNQVALLYAERCLKQYVDFPELLYWRAQLCFLESATREELNAVLPLFDVTVPAEYILRFRQATHRIMQCINLSQDVDSLFSSKDWMGLIDLCSTGINRPFIGDRFRATLLAKRAHAFYEIKHLYECIDDIESALNSSTSKSERAQLYLIKAMSEEKLSRWSDAVRSAELSLKEQHTVEAAVVWRRLCDRQREFQRRKRQQEEQQHKAHEEGFKTHDRNKSGFDGSQTDKGHEDGRKGEKEKNSSSRVVAELYAHLSLPVGAGAERVTKSYRALAMRWHPDKWCGASEQQRKEAEEKFKRVKAAYDELMSIVFH
ncbi:putative TPR-repeat protein [Trypanosoma theileri]|uniref:Putative TPR-repeat protein n=1 Tax=Trypanosoma theileri TaxID=67003 RepID=A0A1X0P804_9TRYP|nr:putative TPR-repeat protein [Trypanosoma theileri]ORC92763.1 putative TPR-repeat protein [Trypanosoma theileri]